MRGGNSNAYFNCYAKPLITHLRMCYVCVMHENITEKNSFEMKFYSALLLAEGKMMKEKQDTCPESLSR